MSASEPETEGYLIRPFDDGDVEAFLALHSRVFDPDYGREWFDWKYRNPPYLDHVPIVVAERDGELTGARPFFALELQVNGEPTLTLQPADTMVHPDHRRKGLFTRMTERALERYRDGEPAFFFNFPNDRSRPGYLKLGWKRVGEVPTYYRVQDPAALTGDDASGWKTLATRVARPLFAGYNRLVDARSRPPPGIRVVGHDAPPPGTFATLGDRGADVGIHVHRDERFYRWRFGTPAWDYVAYVARAGGDLLAGMVVGRSRDGSVAKVTDVAPLPPAVPEDALRSLLARAVRDHAEFPVVAAPPALTRRAAAGAGFHSDGRPPLSAVATRTSHVVRAFDDDWTHNGADLTDPDNWRMTFSERDTS